MYEDVWDLFFSALRQQWGDCNFPILLNTESKNYPNNYGIQVINFKLKSDKDCWGRRYKNALKSVETPYVIPVLEDFVLKEKFTGRPLLEKTILWLDENPDIGVFYLHKHPYVSQQKTEFEGFGLMPQKSEYKLTTAFGIWRKEYLDKCIKGFETPWEWELYVTRSAWKFKEREYALLDDQNEVFVIPWGGVIWRGLWHPEAKTLAEKYGVDIEFSKRGFMDEDDPYRMKSVYSVRKNFPGDISNIRFWIEVWKKVKGEVRRRICEI